MGMKRYSTDGEHTLTVNVFTEWFEVDIDYLYDCSDDQGWHHTWEVLKVCIDDSTTNIYDFLSEEAKAEIEDQILKELEGR